ncbi:uncharacterized protein METZ01_LOCUS273441, partial [marine metagenome]
YPGNDGCQYKILEPDSGSKGKRDIGIIIPVI